MRFPKSTAPKWFVEKLVIQKGMQVISLDDDLSIHQVWKARFLSKDFSSIGSELITFTSGQELKDWFATNQDTKSKRLFLMDYELLNQNATGLQIIEELGIGMQSILVTSRYEETSIREKCERLGVRLIPKAMAGFVPIEIEEPKEFLDCLLIDDDNLIRMTWELAAKDNNKSILTFDSYESFCSKAKSIETQTPIYVDVSLGNGVLGTKIAENLYNMGYKNIYLATGYESSEIDNIPSFIIAICGKDPFFTQPIITIDSNHYNHEETI